MTEPIVRAAARVLLFDERDRLLLFLYEIEGAEAPELWGTPGGGLEEGESFEPAALRELHEETGLREVTLGPCVWLRNPVYRWNGAFHESRERFFVARTVIDGVSLGSKMPELDYEAIREARWWTVDAIRGGGAVFIPRDLGVLLPPIVGGRYPDPPLWVGG